MADKVVPLYALYRTEYRSAQPRYLYLESMGEFIGMYGAQVNAHRHIDLHHFIWLEEGDMMVVLDGERYELKGPALVIVPPPVIHAFMLSREAGGYCLTLASSFVSDLAAQMGKSARARLDRPAVVTGDGVSADAAGVAALFRALEGTFDRRDGYTAIDMFAYGMALMVQTVRVLEVQSGTATRRGGNSLYHEFRALVEHHFYLRWQLADFASALGVSERTLQRACKSATGHTPNDIVQQRMALQAKRELLYTEKTIAEIAETLGFSEVSAFSHFFSRSVGMAPRDFRRTRAEHN